MPSRRYHLCLSGTWFAAAALVLTACPAARARGPAPAEKAAAPGAPVLLTLQDASTLKATLRDEKIEFETRYGKLLIPAAEITRVEFRTRIPAGDARRAEVAVNALGSKEFKEREVASAELLRLGARAYPVLVKAAGDPDAEVSRRAKDLLEKIREAVPAEHLEPRENDVIWAGGCEVSGRIVGDALRVDTLPFGEQRLKLSDVHSLKSPGAATEAVADAPADPGTVMVLANEVGKTFSFKVTGVADGAAMPAPVVARPGGVIVWGGPARGMVWGTDIYSCDSTLAMAAVHAGVLKSGQTGVVKVKILGPQAGFRGSVRHGVTTMEFGPFPGFSVSK
jgi:hypothetical protein